MPARAHPANQMLVNTKVDWCRTAFAILHYRHRDSSNEEANQNGHTCRIFAIRYRATIFSGTALRFVRVKSSLNQSWSQQKLAIMTSIAFMGCCSLKASSLHQHDY